MRKFYWFEKNMLNLNEMPYYLAEAMIRFDMEKNKWEKEEMDKAKRDAEVRRG